MKTIAAKQTVSAEVEQTGGAAPRVGLLAKVRYRLSSVLAMAAVMVVGSTAAAFADGTPTTTDPLDGGGDSIFTTLTAYLQTHLITLVLGLATVAIAISLVLRWVKRAVSA